MKHISLLIVSLILFSSSLLAQHSVQGKVLDKKDEAAVEMATVRLLNARDSSLVQGCFTDSRGAFTLQKVKPGNYILQVRFLGYNHGSQNFTMADKSVFLKTIYMDEIQKALKEIEVTGMTAQMAVKGDTVEYNPAAFKVAENAVVEDLLKRLPGVVVDADGKITVNGEEIKKVRVDGKKFFSDDVQMATKNIPVDMIDKVQVVDQKSEMAQLTGFEDENTERIINLTTRPNRKKGVFGNVGAGGGADMDGQFRYDANTFLNIMSGESQTAIIAGANNVNTQRSGRGRGGMGGMGGSGITETQNIGVNNNMEISKKLKVGGNGSFNHSNNYNESVSEKTNYLSDTTTNQTNNESKSTRDNQQASMRLELEWNIDTLSTLIVQPEINYSKGFTESLTNYENFTNGDSTSWGDAINQSQSDGLDAGLRFIFSKKSAAKKGRSFTLNVYGSMNDSKSNGQNLSSKYSASTTRIIDQHTTNESSSYSGEVRASFVEPLWDLKNFLEVAASIRANIRESEKLQYNQDGSGNYNQLDSVYSNRFENQFYNESLEVNFRHQDQSYNYMLGFRAEPSQNRSVNDYFVGNDLIRDQSIWNFAPTASFRYNFGRRKFARLEYRGRTTQPSIEQMQPVKNNNNLTRETVGNMDLLPAFDNTLRLMYSSFNQEKFSSFSAGLNGGFTKDALVTNSVFDETNKEYSQTVNSRETPFNMNANLMFNTPIIQKRLQFNTRTEVNYRERFGYSLKTTNDNIDLDNLIPGDLGRTISKGFSENLSLTFTTDVVELGLRGAMTYNNSINSLNPTRNQRTTDYTGSANLNLHLPYDFTVSNDMSYTSRDGYSTFTQDEWVWNASVDKSVFQKKGTVSFRMYDILRQKLNIRESISDNSRTLSRSNMLTSYFMLSFTYRIARFGGGASQQDMFRNRRGGYGGGGFGGGGFGGMPGGGPEM